MTNNHALPHLAATPEATVAAVETAVAFLKARGLRPSGRFHKFLSMLQDHRDGKPVDQRLLPQAFQDLHQLVSIAEQFEDCDQPEFEEKLRLVVNDPADPRDSKAETPGRDHQFELFLASQLKARGAREVFFEEPDVVIDIGGLFFGFAAKRPKSRKRIRDRLRGAVGQLQEVGASGRITHGVAALDVTFLGNPQGLAAVPIHTSATGSAAEDLVVRAEARYIEETGMMSRLLKGKDVRLTCGVLLFGAITLYIPETGGVVNSGNFHTLRLGPGYRDALDLLSRTLQ